MIPDNLYILIGVLIFAFLVSITLEMMALPRLIYIAKKKSLFEIPNDRKSHLLPTPRLAGVTFFPILLLVFSVCTMILAKYITNKSLTTIEPTLAKLFGMLAGNVLLMGIGIKDDLVGSRYSHKIGIQILAAILLVYGGLYINSFNGLFGIWDIPSWAGIPFTVLLVVFITNAIKLIDGTDGLASGLSSVALISLGILFFIREMFFCSLICIILVGVLIPFFYYNVFKTTRKISMGETGSYTLGFMLAYLGIRFAMDTPENYGQFNSPVLIVLSTLLVPMFDELRVILTRLFTGKSIFAPDRSHIHHKLIDLGFSHRKVMVSLLICAELLVLLNVYLLPKVNINILFAVDMAILVGSVTILNTCLIVPFKKAVNQ